MQSYLEPVVVVEPRPALEAVAQAVRSYLSLEQDHPRLPQELTDTEALVRCAALDGAAVEAPDL